MSTMTSSNPGPPPPVATEVERDAIRDDPERKELHRAGLARRAEAHRLTVLAQANEDAILRNYVQPHTVPLTRAEEQRQRAHGGAAGTS